MKKDLFGGIWQEPEDYMEMVVNELKLQPYWNILVNENTDHGFSTNYNQKLPSKCIYILYKGEKPVYIGQTQTSVRTRIGRFLAGVRGTEHKDEKHPGAYKYRRYHGTNLDDLTFKVSEMDVFDLPNYISIDDVENCLIYKLRPDFNNQIYKSNNITSCVRTL